MEFESWGTTFNKMDLHWNRDICWINPKLNTTMNKHTVNALFVENEPNVYGKGVYETSAYRPISKESNSYLLPSGREFASISLILTLTRKIDFYMSRVYIPSTCLVLIGGLSTLMPLSYVPGITVRSVFNSFYN